MNHPLPDETTMFHAFTEKDSHYEGIFYTGVKTTGIFCRPTCPARKPKRENVIFFRTTKDALDHGYRPCKRCQPMVNPANQPQWITDLIDEIESAPQTTIKDADISARGLDPNRVRRWFKQNHGMTFQAYQRALRINQAVGHLKNGESVTETAFDSGYQSLSGFQDSFKKHMGTAPKNGREKTIVHTTRIETPLGPMIAGVAEDAVCLLEFSDRRMLETQFTRLRKYLNAEILPGSHPLLNELEKQVEAYFAGKLKIFDLPLLTPGTDFQRNVWLVLLTIPYGETRSYKEIAVQIDKPNAMRAVGHANGDNRLAIILPCHRVIAENGELTGYGGGLWRKRYLLELEKTFA